MLNMIVEFGDCAVEVATAESNPEVFIPKVEHCARDEKDFVALKKGFAELIGLDRGFDFWEGNWAGFWAMPHKEVLVFLEEFFQFFEVPGDDFHVAF